MQGLRCEPDVGPKNVDTQIETQATRRCTIANVIRKDAFERFPIRIAVNRGIKAVAAIVAAAIEKTGLDFRLT